MARRLGWEYVSHLAAARMSSMSQHCLGLSRIHKSCSISSSRSTRRGIRCRRIKHTKNTFTKTSKVCSQLVRTMRNKRPKSQSPRHHQGNDSGKNMRVNQQLSPMSLPPPPSSHPARSVRRKEDGRGEHTNQQLLAPPPPSYHAYSVKGINDGKGVHTNHQIPPPPQAYRPPSLKENAYGRGVQANQQLLPPPPPSYRANSIRGNNDGRGVHTNQHIPPPSYCHIDLLHLEEMIMAKVCMQTRGNKCFNRHEWPMSEYLLYCTIVNSMADASKKRDIRWNYGTQGATKDLVTCNFCGSTFNGGITRHKQHLVGGFKNVKQCTACPSAIREEVRAYIQNKIANNPKFQVRQPEEYIDIDDVDDMDKRK
ncbi:hypothetical protein H5410_046930 [Solanum commersonii]|uniref:BED-type domain-containing protein n=1 Tax=Solanum commersonii TaxID=4109 RepID=A0A9J5XHS6_SOLCO|nr:hypothetical protein H5410_046930 [Solanum commersonii]